MSINHKYKILFNNIKLIFTPLHSVKTHFHLLREFIAKDIKGRFAGSMAGILWALITPLSHIIIYYFIFSTVMRIQITPAETGTDSFFIYFLSAFFPWTILSESIIRSSGVLLENSNLITKVVFPVELLPICSLASSLIINGIGYILFLAYLAILDLFHPVWLVLIPAMMLYLIFISGLTYLLAALCVFLRDIRELTGQFLMIWFYATPVIYPISMIPDGFADIIKWNPASLYIHIFREILLFHRFPADAAVPALAFSLFSYCLGAWFFMKSKNAFGDVL